MKLLARLLAILSCLATALNLSASEDKSMADVTGVTTSVTNAVTVMDSATALISGFQGLLDAAIAEAIAANDNADLSALTDLSSTLDAKSAELASAVVANTPAEPPA